MSKRATMFIAIIVLFLSAGVSYLIFNKSDDTVTQKESLLSPEDKNRAEQSLENIKKSIEEVKNNPEISQDKETMFGLYVQLAQHYRILGNLEEAKKSYEQAIEVGVSTDRAWSALAGVLEEMNRPQDAYNAINEAINLMPSNPDYWRARLALEQNVMGYSADKIDNTYNEALNNTGSHIDIITSYARYLDNIGNYEKAIEYWQMAIEANPNNTELYEQQITRIQEKM